MEGWRGERQDLLIGVSQPHRVLKRVHQIVPSSHIALSLFVTIIILYATDTIGARRKIIATIIHCESPEAPVSRRAMMEEPLQVRAKKAGLTQKRLAEILGVTETTASLQLRGKWASGTPQYVLAVLIAWEFLSHDQRMRWLDELAELKRREKP